MRAVLEKIDRATDSDVPVLLQGESGTGKELAARCLHDNGPRSRHPFVAVNCAAIPETLLESELFGHVAGAFTGAVRERPGVFSLADRGTLFLDEIGEMSPPMQAKLLRALQEREVCPLGGTATRRVDVRLVCATNRDLAELVRERRFREDLFYRVNVVRIDLPPLRERPEDIPVLCDFFLRPAGRTLSPGACQRVLRHPWPGNVRELANVLARAGVLGAGPVIEEAELDLPEPPVDLPSPLESLDRFLDRAIRVYLFEVLRRARGSRRRAAAILNVDRSTLYRLMRKHGIEPAPRVASSCPLAD
jgi:two-component system NtrC family response regulator